MFKVHLRTGSTVFLRAVLVGCLFLSGLCLGDPELGFQQFDLGPYLSCRILRLAVVRRARSQGKPAAGAYQEQGSGLLCPDFLRPLSDHGCVLTLVFLSVRSAPTVSTLRGIVLTGCAFALSILICAASYRFVEGPLIRMAHRKFRFEQPGAVGRDFLRRWRTSSYFCATVVSNTAPAAHDKQSPLFRGCREPRELGEKPCTFGTGIRA